LTSTSAELDNFDVVFEQFTGDAGLFEAYFSYFTQTSTNTSLLDFKVTGNNQTIILFFQVRFYAILEFVESGAHRGFQPTEDTLIQRYTLVTESWFPFTSFTSGSLIEFNATTTQATLGLHGYVSSNIVTLPKSNFDLSSSEVKFDVFLNFISKYRQSGTTLALEARIKTWTKVAPGNSANYITFFGNQNAAASFNWVPTATDGNGNVVNVIASNLTLVTERDNFC
jgi:hypothetical protein